LRKRLSSLPRPLVFFGGLLIIVLVVSLLIRAFTGESGRYRYILHTGDNYSGDLAVAAQVVDIQPNSQVSGNLAIMALNSVHVAGKISGRLSILAPLGDVQIDSGTAIDGSVTICARNLTLAEPRTVTGNIDRGCDQLGSVASGSFSGVASGFPPIPLPFFSRYGGNFFQMLITSFAVAAIAALLTMIFPGQMRRISEAFIRRPRIAGTVGFLSMGAALGLTLAYVLLSVVTFGVLCVLLPIAAVAWIVITVALVIGWIAIGVPLGKVLLRSTHVPPMASGAIGTLVLTLGHGLLEMTPCTGWLAGLLLLVVGSMGFGAVLLTRLGTRAYPEYIRYSNPI